MNYNTNLIEEPTLDHLKNYAPFFFKSLQEFLEYNFNILDLDKIYDSYGLSELTEQYGYARELDGTRYDIVIKIVDKPEKFNFQVLNNVNELQSQNCILTFINNTIKMIKYSISGIGKITSIDFPNVTVDGDINLSLDGTEIEKYINININIGNSKAKTYIVDK